MKLFLYALIAVTFAAAVALLAPKLLGRAFTYVELGIGGAVVVVVLLVARVHAMTRRQARHRRQEMQDSALW